MAAEHSETSEELIALHEAARGFDAVSKSLTDVSERLDRDKRFRRWTMVAVAIGWVVVTALSSYTLHQSLTEDHRVCMRSNVFRQDIYNGIDSTLDSLTVLANDDPSRAAIAKAKLDFRKEIPLRQC